MSFKNQRSFSRAVSGKVGLALMLTLTSMASREGRQTTIGNARSFAAPLQDVGASIEIDAPHRLGQVNKLLFGNYIMGVARADGIFGP